MHPANSKHWDWGKKICTKHPGVNTLPCPACLNMQDSDVVYTNPNPRHARDVPELQEVAKKNREAQSRRTEEMVLDAITIARSMERRSRMNNGRRETVNKILTPAQNRAFESEIRKIIKDNPKREIVWGDRGDDDYWIQSRVR